MLAGTCTRRVRDALWDMGGRLQNEVAGRGIDAVLSDLRATLGLAGAAGHDPTHEDLVCGFARSTEKLTVCGIGIQAESPPSCSSSSATVPSRWAPGCAGAGHAGLAEKKWPHLRERIRNSAESDALVRTLEGHQGAGRGVAVTPDGELVASISLDHTIQIWRLSTGQILRTLKGSAPALRGPAVSPIGVAVTPDGRHVIMASFDHSLQLLEVSTGNAVATLRGHTDSVAGVTTTRDGRFALSASWDRTAKLWDLAYRNLRPHARRARRGRPRRGSDAGRAGRRDGLGGSDSTGVGSDDGTDAPHPRRARDRRQRRGGDAGTGGSPSPPPGTGP